MGALIGSENIIVQASHMFLLSKHVDEHAGLTGFSNGISTSNQRIEGYWLTLLEMGLDGGKFF